MPDPLLYFAMSLDGELDVADDAAVSADDRGLTRGYGCFDAMRVRYVDDEAVVDFRDPHLARLRRSAEALGIACPPDEAWIAAIEQALAGWKHRDETILKVMLTGGRESRPSVPRALLSLAPLPESAILARSGIDVVTLSRGVRSDAYADAPWLLGGVKTLAYAVNVAVHDEAVARGADDALFVSTDGFALEGPTSGLLVRRGATWATTPLGATGVLRSVTVEHLLHEIEATGQPWEYALLTPQEVSAADGAWLVSAVRGVAPIRRLDGVELTRDPQLDAWLADLAGF